MDAAVEISSLKGGSTVPAKWIKGD